jgi:prepilin-type N-terminal cleavage/methylation domain-containing protein
MKPFVKFTDTVREAPVLRQSRQTRHGFTLIEIMIVVTIIGFLSAIAVPAWAKSRNLCRVKSCLSNLRMLQSAKTQWALDSRKADSDVPVEADLVPYILGSVMPQCPVGGTYDLKATQDNATCSLAATGHVLP